MSLSIGGNNNINAQYNLNNNNSNIQNNITNSSIPMQSDSLNLSSTSGMPPEKAGAWKKFSSSVGEMFGNIADKFGFGKTYKVVADEFKQVDSNRDASLNRTEFNLATLNLFDFPGTEFARADKNKDGKIQEKEYVSYRKQQFEVEFNRRDRNNDNHLNVNEIGVIGKQLLANRDPRLDENQDGLLTKGEFTRGAIKGSMSIRDILSGL